MGREKAADTCVYYSVTGSPPHGRGKGGCCSGVHWRHGITPAWAGKRDCRYHGMAYQQDHPRVGGEKFPTNGDSVAKQGSPPRGRGKGSERQAGFDPAGITPAWAGKSQSFIKWQWKIRDHPRVGGEKPEWAPITFLMLGSPPRGRGKGYEGHVNYNAIRITPAWAGKSYACCPVLSLSEDHPRVGGEKLCVLSSPLFV